MDIINRIFLSLSFAIIVMAGFIVIVPSVLMPGIMYPDRIDSVYVISEQQHLFAQTKGDTSGSATDFVFNPSSLRMSYRNFNITTTDSLTLRGWYIPVQDTEAATILMIHDINESKITLLDVAKQLHDRNFNLCLVDMRAHGNSDGNEFTLGGLAVADVKIILDSLFCISETRHVCIFGIGTGAAIAIQTMSRDDRAEMLIAQSCFDNFENYAERYSHRKWGNMTGFFYPMIKRKLEKQLGFPLQELCCSEIIKYVFAPSLFITGSTDPVIPPSDTYAIADSSAAINKDYYLVINAGHSNVDEVGGKEYYDRIMQFILTAIPKKEKVFRNKKLVYSD